jgi:hypothetical protein
MTRAALAACLIASIGAAACGPVFAAAQPGDRAPIPIVRLTTDRAAFSTYSGFGDSLRTVIRDSVLWRQVWRQIHRPYVPQPEVPRIDFDREMVILAAMGTRRSGGYGVVIEGAERDSAAIEVDVRSTSPAAGCPVESVMTQPVDVARIPASARTVRFRERRVVTSCGSP